MADKDERMVLRTVYLTPDVDEELRIQAFQLDRSKNDLIREAVTRYLKGQEEGRVGTPAGETVVAVAGVAPVKNLVRSRSAISGRARVKGAPTARHREVVD